VSGTDLQLERAQAADAAALVASGPKVPAATAAEVGRPHTSLIDSPVLDRILYHGEVLSDGDRGYAVKVVQTALRRAGVLLRAGADGHYGPATRNAVMQFQRENGLVPTGLLDRLALLALDQVLQALDRGDRTEALPAPRPLRGLPASYLEQEPERKAYEEIRDGLVQIRDRTTTAPEANVDDFLVLMERLDALDGATYRSVLRALAASRESNAWAPTLLDLLLALPSTLSDEVEFRERLCRQLVDKLGRPGRGAPTLLAHVSPDSVTRLQGAPCFPALLGRTG